MDKQEAAVFALEAMGWSFDGERWAPPRSKWGPNALEAVEAMAGYLQDKLDYAMERAPKDVYWASVVDQIGPILAAWEETKPKAQGFHHDA